MREREGEEVGRQRETEGEKGKEGKRLRGKQYSLMRPPRSFRNQPLYPVLSCIFPYLILMLKMIN